ncbi:MAG: hypothetical protein ACLUFF_03935, partial [Acutalibacteraceae bacterium]
MKKGWKLYTRCLALVLAAALSGCSGIEEEKSNSIYQPPINPMVGQNVSETITTNLYYLVEGEEQLASVSQTIGVASGQTKEEAVLQTLLMGPPSNTGLS